MARTYIRTSNESALVDVAPVSTYPYCMGVWVKKLGGSSTETLMFFGDKDTFPDAFTRFVITKFGKIQADSAHTTNLIVSASAYDDDLWHSFLLVERDTGRLRYLDFYIDGNLEGTANSSNAGGLSIFNRIAFGRKMTSTPGNALTGTLAEGFIADINPTAQQVAAWAKGASARHVFGTSLKGYWPQWGLHSPEIDLSGQQNDLTLSGTSTSTHAPVVPYTPKWAASLPASAAATRRISIDGIVIDVAA